MMPARPPPMARGVGEAEIVRVAAGVLVDGDQARHAAAALVFGAHGVAGALGRDHQHVEIGARLDQVEMDVEAVREHQRRALLHVGRELVAVDVGLQLVGRQHHHDVGPFGGARRRHHLDAFGFGLLGRRASRPQRHGDVLDAAVAHVEHMGVALAAVADDGDLLALDEIEIGVPIVIDAHVMSFAGGSTLLRCERGQARKPPSRSRLSRESARADQARRSAPRPARTNIDAALDGAAKPL